MTRLILLFSSIVFLTSCVNVIRVREKDRTPNSAVQTLDGLPFYVKVEKFSQTTVYSKTWLTATLTVKKKLVDTQNGKEVQLGTGKQLFVKLLPKTDNAKLDPIRTAIINAGSDGEAGALAVVRNFNRLKGIVDDSSIAPVLLKNVIEPDWVVDDSRQYYLNAPLPWFGTGNLTQELNADGTLSKVTSNPDTKLAEGISALLPLKEYLTGEFVKSGTSAAADTTTQSATALGMGMLKSENPALTLTHVSYIYDLSLSVEETGYEYTFTTKPEDAWPSPATPIAFNAANAMVSRRDLGSSAKSGERNSAGPTVRVSGGITFPKDWGAAKPKQ